MPQAAPNERIFPGKLERRVESKLQSTSGCDGKISASDTEETQKN
jgi:hypothetical protein